MTLDLIHEISLLSNGSGIGKSVFMKALITADFENNVVRRSLNAFFQP